jgi:hypothetical protein
VKYVLRDNTANTRILTRVNFTRVTHGKTRTLSRQPNLLPALPTGLSFDDFDRVLKVNCGDLFTCTVQQLERGLHQRDAEAKGSISWVACCSCTNIYERFLF